MIRYPHKKWRALMNNEWSYEEYLEWDREYRYYEMLEYLTNKYFDSFDRDDMRYPPAEYWESGI